MVSKVVHSHKSDEWPTAQDFFDMLDAEFNFTLDPCASSENAKCDTYFTLADNGLLQDWGRETVFVNPPYSQAIDWIEKAALEAARGAIVVMLMASRTGTDWFCDHVMIHASEIRFVRKRLRFGGGKNSAPFDSIVIVFRPEHKKGEPPTISTIGRNSEETLARIEKWG